MKEFLYLFLALLVCVEVEGQEKPTKEDFNSYNLQKVNFLPATVTYGKFVYEFRNEGQLVDSSSLVTNFDDDGSLFIGQQRKITEFLIKTVEGEEFDFNSFQLSSNHAYANPNEAVVVRGWRDGKVVTPPVELEITLFEPPGDEFDFTLYQGFGKVDEIKITGEDLQFTLESFTYKNSTGQVAKDNSTEEKKD